MSWRTITISSCIILLFALIGWEIGNPRSLSEPSSKATRSPSPLTPKTLSPPPTPLKGERTTPALPADAPGALKKERIVTFPSSAEAEAFLSQAQLAGLKILGRGRRGNTLNIGYENLSDLSALLPENAEVYYNYPVFPPYLEDGMLSPGATGFNGRMKEWMGIQGDNSAWGEGVSVAVIDTGISNHPVFADGIKAYSLVETKGNETLHPHGTAMASLWRETDGRIPAIAPAVDLTSIQVSGESGVSNTFILADAIFLAADEGADLITISMSSLNTNPYLGTAIRYAKENGSLIVASSGNNGEEIAVYPAAHPDVLAVGAIDYNSNYPGFSNYGEQIDFVAPGVGILTAGEDETYGASTGTSPAAQIGAATIAAFMSETGETDPYKARDLYLENLNELGLPDKDTVYGNGRPQMDVLLNYDTPGRHDVAIAGNLFEVGENGIAQLQVVVDNPGTEKLTNATLNVTARGKSYEVELPGIAAKESYQFSLPIPLSLNTESIQVSSRVTLPEGQEDVRPQDNSQISNMATN